MYVVDIHLVLQTVVCSTCIIIYCNLKKNVCYSISIVATKIKFPANNEYASVMSVHKPFVNSSAVAVEQGT